MSSAHALKEPAVVGLSQRSRRSRGEAQPQPRGVAPAGGRAAGRLAVVPEPSAADDAAVIALPLDMVSCRRFALSAGRPVALPQRWRREGVAMVVVLTAVLVLKSLRLDAGAVMVVAGLLGAAAWMIVGVAWPALGRPLASWMTPPSATRLAPSRRADAEASPITHRAS